MDVTIDDIFEAMPGRFRPEVAGEWRAAIQFRFEREGGEALRWLRVADGSCAVGEGEIEAPTCTVRTSADAWIGMVLGKLNPMQVFTSGQLRLEGNLADAMRLSDPRLFPRPEIVGPPPSEG
ncbi:MAG: SCP2 sterol-binding domain-containing protein [Sandaracinaceae bacterium]|nr:SCP2 sterol-binding domain-containing protein [Sandaracinaceae bacterium]